MQKAKKLPSGKFRIRVQKLIGNKKVDKTFTAETKRDCETMAIDWLNEMPADSDCVTVKMAIDRYMDSHEPILSPSTARAYKACIKKLEPLYELDTSLISSADVQTFVSQLAVDGLSPKTIKNVYGFLISVLQSVTDKHYKVTLPKMEKREKTVPTETQVKMLLAEAEPKLKLAILLGICTMRRGEVCALKYGDVSRDMKMIRIHADMVYTTGNEWVYKDKAKTVESNRSVLVPQEAIDLIGEGDPDQFIFEWNPCQLTHRFERLRDQFGFECRFHDMRAFGASFMHYLNIPEQYILSQGGWTGNGVMQSVYRTSLSDKRSDFAKVQNEYISKTLLG